MEMKLKKEIEIELGKLRNPNWKGETYPDSKRKFIRLYELLGCLSKMVDDYLMRPRRTVLKTLKHDKFPINFLKVLLEEELSDKKRPEVIKFLEDKLPKPESPKTYDLDHLNHINIH